MIDWVTCRVRYNGPPVFLKTYSQNVLTGEITEERNKCDYTRGSWEAGLQVSVEGGSMRLSGNFVKFLTGQNVVGTDDLEELTYATYRKVLEIMAMPDCFQAERDFLRGHVFFTRVDCTFHYHVGTNDDVRAWLQAVESSVHVKYRGKGHYDEGMQSVLFGVSIKEGFKATGSKYSSFKFYSKATELRKRGRELKCHHDYKDRLTEYVQGRVRAEAKYNSRELKLLGVDKLSAWGPDTSRDLNNKWIEKMQFSNNFELMNHEFEALPTFLRSTYRLWAMGEDVRGCLARPTFYRHRKGLLDYGIDISVSREMQNPAARQVRPVIEVLRATPVDTKEEEKWFWEMAQKRA